MVQDLLHDLLLGDEGEHDPAAAAWNSRARLRERRAREALPRGCGRSHARRGLRWRWCGIRSRTRPWRALLWAREDLTPPGRRRTEHAMVADQVRAGWWHQRR